MILIMGGERRFCFIHFVLGRDSKDTGWFRSKSVEVVQCLQNDSQDPESASSAVFLLTKGQFILMA